MTAIKSLGEIVLRTPNIGDMSAFYRDVLGLTPILQTDEVVFFEVAPGYGGHTQVLALFDQSVPPDHPDAHQEGVDASRSPMHHFAFSVGLEDYKSEQQRLERLGHVVRTAEHAWVKWRSLYLTDPDGNVVELVCYDDAVEE